MGHDRCKALGGIRISDRLQKHLWEVTRFRILTVMVNKPINKLCNEHKHRNIEHI